VGGRVSDGAADLREELGKHCGQLILDFWHIAGYLANNFDRMDYAAAVREKLPIDSGITEAACKTVVKARLCGGGMRWRLGSMQQVL
jgi:hypothetical protein